MGSKLFFNQETMKQQKYSGGILSSVTSDEAPGFVNVSFASLKLNKNGSMEPIWHPNANKIGYCLQGKALVSIRSPDELSEFIVQQGDVFFIPKGYVHQIANTGNQETQISFALNHQKPETMCLSK